MAGPGRWFRGPGAIVPIDVCRAYVGRGWWVQSYARKDGRPFFGEAHRTVPAPRGRLPPRPRAPPRAQRRRAEVARMSARPDRRPAAHPKLGSPRQRAARRRPLRRRRWRPPRRRLAGRAVGGGLRPWARSRRTGRSSRCCLPAGAVGGEVEGGAGRRWALALLERDECSARARDREPGRGLQRALAGVI